MKHWMRWALPLAVVAIAAIGSESLAKKSPATETKPVPVSIYDFHVRTIAGTDTVLAAYRGKALLIVNTASKCGFTPQYKSLEALYEKYHAQGFEVLAFPANNFGSQEPGTDAEIQTFCEVNFKTTFPLFSKISVKGADIAPLYLYLTQKSPFPGEIEWNFTKFLIAPDGRVVARFSSKIDPLTPEVTGPLEATLAAR